MSCFATATLLVTAFSLSHPRMQDVDQAAKKFHSCPSPDCGSLAMSQLQRVEANLRKYVEAVNEKGRRKNSPEVLSFEPRKDLQRSRCEEVIECSAEDEERGRPAGNATIMFPNPGPLISHFCDMSVKDLCSELSAALTSFALRDSLSAYEYARQTVQLFHSCPSPDCDCRHLNFAFFRLQEAEDLCESSIQELNRRWKEEKPPRCLHFERRADLKKCREERKKKGERNEGMWGERDEVMYMLDRMLIEKLSIHGSD